MITRGRVAERPGADPEITTRAETISSTRANVEGILRWLEKTEPAAE